MNTQLQTVNPMLGALDTIKYTKDICSALMSTKHYAKMGEEGIFAIVSKARSLNIDPLDALNGGLYFVQGKVEMSGQMMLNLIRQAGHSVQVDSKSTNTMVIMHGRRADNNDTWTVSFGIEDAKKAGIYKNMWEKYPQVMSTWRCVSMLGRFLFSDVIKGAYVEGEISDAGPMHEPPKKHQRDYVVEVEQIETITAEQADELMGAFQDCPQDFQEKVKSFMVTNKFAENQEFNFYQVPVRMYASLSGRILKKLAEITEEKMTAEDYQQAAQ